jgi:hypothetical protein
MFSAVAGNSLNKAMGKAKDKLGGKKSWNTNKYSAKEDQNLSDVKSIVEEDDKLHAEVQQILAEDGKSSTYATQ